MNIRSVRGSLIWTVAILATMAGTTYSVEPADLSDVVFINHFIGSDEAQKTLACEGFVCTGTQVTQMFEVYDEVGYGESIPPRLITTDCMLDAYNQLLAAGVIDMERRQAVLLAQFSRRLYEILITRDDRVSQDLARLAAVGLAIQNPDTIETLRPQHAKDAQAILPIIDGQKSRWRFLFFETPISASLFKPIGFYTRSEELRAYFKTRRWYAVCPFRFDSEKETRRAVALSQTIVGDETLLKLYRQLTEPQTQMLGRPDDIEPLLLARLVQASNTMVDGSLDALHAKIAALDASDLPPLNDLQATVGQTSAERLSFRVFPARRTPDSVLLGRTTNDRIAGRYFPSGIDVFAVGPLASEAGRRALKLAVGNQHHYEAILSAEPVELSDTLYDRTLDALKLLQQPVDVRVPEVFRRAAWQDKQLGTQLGGWAGLKHTWVLHTKSMGGSGCAPEIPPAYVSPYPEFFRRLADLADRTAAALPKIDLPEPVPSALDPSVEGTIDPYAFSNTKFVPNKKIVECFELFSKTSRRLADIADRQIVGTPFTNDDRQFIYGFGYTMKKIHFYDTPESPARDDHPIVSPVFTTGRPATGTLQVGLSRPEILFAVLPVGKKRVLHIGAIYSYRETITPPVPPMDDKQWRELLSTDKFPQPPRFTDSYRKLSSYKDVLEAAREGKIHPQLGKYDTPELTAALYEAIADPTEEEIEDEYSFGGKRQMLLCEFCNRAKQEDMSRLIAMIDRPLLRDDIQPISKAINRHDASDYVDRLHELAFGDEPQKAAQARIILSYTRLIHIDRIASEFDKGSIALREELCGMAGSLLFDFLHNQLPQVHSAAESKEVPPNPAERFLLHALDDRAPSVRLVAASKIANAYKVNIYSIENDNQRESFQVPKRIADRIVMGIDDPHLGIAAYMARIAAAMELEAAGPKILQRLENWPDASTPAPSWPERKSRSRMTMVSTPWDRVKPSWWIEAASRLKLVAAKDAIYKLCLDNSHPTSLRYNPWIPANIPSSLLIGTILELEGKTNNDDALLEIARDTKLRGLVRTTALEYFIPYGSAPFDDWPAADDPHGENRKYTAELVDAIYAIADSKQNEYKTNFEENASGTALMVCARILRRVAIQNGLADSKTWGEFPLPEKFAPIRLRVIADVETWLDTAWADEGLEILAMLQAPSLTTERLEQIALGTMTTDPAEKAQYMLTGRRGGYPYEKAALFARSQWILELLDRIDKSIEADLTSGYNYPLRNSEAFKALEKFLCTDPEEVGPNREAFEKIRQLAYPRLSKMLDKATREEIVDLLSRVYYYQYFELAESRLANPFTKPAERIILLYPLYRKVYNPEQDRLRINLILRFLDDESKFDEESRVCDEVARNVIMWSDNYEEQEDEAEPTPEEYRQIAKQLLKTELEGSEDPYFR